MKTRTEKAAIEGANARDMLAIRLNATGHECVYMQHKRELKKLIAAPSSYYPTELEHGKDAGMHPEDCLSPLDRKVESIAKQHQDKPSCTVCIRCYVSSLLDPRGPEISAFFLASRYRECFPNIGKM